MVLRTTVNSPCATLSFLKYHKDLQCHVDLDKPKEGPLFP